MLKPQFTYRAQVVRVIDADTVDFTIDLGFCITARIRVRVRGINAPERDTTAGKEAKAAVEALLPVKSTIVLTTYPQDKYGRWLGDIDTRVGDLGAFLLSMGLAVPYMV